MKSFFSNIIRKKRYWLLFSFVLVLLAAYIFRVFLLQSAYSFLHVGIYPEKEYAYGLVLGGEPLYRPAAAAELYHKGKIKQLICTGSQIPYALEAVGIMTTEAEASRNRLLSLGVPDSAIIVLKDASSTREEVNALNAYFKDKSRTTLLIITTESHTRRARGIFREYADEWTEIEAYGVAPKRYDADYWWRNEFGFLAVYEEYLKLVYYWVMY